ncbi:MAG: V-type ATP synthase subunit D [Clostridia bacterium]|nr:V-type ATP synthase subunit D [Clostridia bacterium]
MATMRVNPTRMELTRLKKRLVTAIRGHKLLKDKRDELMRQFLEIVRQNRVLREKVEKGIEEANRHFVIARSVMQNEMLSAALMLPKQQVSLEVGNKNIMSVNIPVFETKTKTDNPNDIFSYGYAFTTSDLDDAVLALAKVLPDMLALAESEKSAQLLADEIEKTRRRVNALEHVMIPDLQDTIRFITMKLDESERSNLTRLMKVKDMMIEQTIRERQAQNAR